MALHHQVMHHVRKHHTKYLFGAWILSWVTIAKILGLTVLFFWMSQGTQTASDYYDVEYQRHTALENPSISATIIKNIIQTGNNAIKSTNNGI